MYSGEKAFKLYDTFGLPLDFMVDAARDQGIQFDQSGFDRAMEEQRATRAGELEGRGQSRPHPRLSARCRRAVFEGYRQTESDDCEVLAIIKGGQGVQELKAGEEGEIVLDHTPFYAESGGQVGDKGWLYSDDHNTVVADVKGVH